MSTLVHIVGKKQSGVAAVEFALIAGLLFTIVFGIFEVGRLIFYLNTAGEATAMGARMAVVCDTNDTTIKQRMRALLPILDSDADIVISYQQLAGCTPTASADCITSATVEIADGVQINTYLPYVSFGFAMPKFRTQLRRESMNSYGTTNPVCN